jgi:very-short-patch-repair endonuclease
MTSAWEECLSDFDPLVTDALARAADSFLQEMHDFVIEMTPIEQLFISQFFHNLNTFDYERKEDGEPYAVLILSHGGDPIRVVQQFEIRIDGHDYRPDFAFIGDRLRLFVECDGHDFHEKTKAQAARDKRRDRAFVMAGWTVLHFTGSEIWKNARSCAIQTFEVVESLLRQGTG